MMKSPRKFRRHLRQAIPWLILWVATAASGLVMWGHNTASLNRRAVWMDGRHRWAVVVSERLGIQAPTPPPRWRPDKRPGEE